MGKKNKQKQKNKGERHDEDQTEQLRENQKVYHDEEQEEISQPVGDVEQEMPSKREHDGDDSEDELKPKRKKKKKPIIPTEDDGDDSEDELQPKRKKKKKPIIPTEDNTGNKKGQKSIRQMKREKHAQRQAEAQAVSKDQHKSDCLNYLSQWKHNRQNWKFMKAKQVWLFKNKFSTSLVPDASWPTLLEYFDSAQGNIRSLLLDDANKIIKQLDDWTESQSKENEDEETDETQIAKPDDSVYKRARDLIQCLQE